MMHGMIRIFFTMKYYLVMPVLYNMSRKTVVILSMNIIQILNITSLPKSVSMKVINVVTRPFTVWF